MWRHRDRRIEITVRSNGSLKIAGSKVTLAGQVSHAGEVSIASKASTPGGVVHDPDAHPLPFGWDIADVAPGGSRALAAGGSYHHHDGDWTSGAASIAPGVHYIDGNVVIGDSSGSKIEIKIAPPGSFVRVT